MRLVIGLVALLAALVVPFAAPSGVSAHPLGNFTINHFSRVVVDGRAIRIHQVVDMAEIPTVTERQWMDADDDGAVSPSESDTYLAATVPSLGAALELEVDGAALELRGAGSARLDFPAGQAGLPTLRIELDLVADLPAAASRAGTISATFRDTSHPDRVGWREIVVVARPGARLTDASVGELTVSDELRSYPEHGLEDPIDVRQASFRAELGEVSSPVTPARGAETGDRGGQAERDPLATLLAGSRGGRASALLLAILVSVGLGAAHAASPGHGKTLMTAYLIGARGTPSQALRLALTVAVTHTVGVFVLGAIVLAASEAFVPQRVMEWLGLAAGLIVLAMGISLMARLVRGMGSADHDHPDAGDHAHGYRHGHRHGHGRRPHGHGHAHAAERVSGRSMALIGVAGGLVPSASALIVLLVAVSQGQLALGIAMVVAFGSGMALVLGGLGLAVVVARRRLHRRGIGLASHPLAARIGGAIPVVSALAVLAIGIFLAAEGVAAIT